MSFARPAFLVLCLAATPGAAADFSDPTWPCIQRKVENLSLGLMWPHEVAQAGGAADDALPRDAANLAETLALRGVDCILIDRSHINAGASGANHGVLHSGARYVASDHPSACLATPHDEDGFIR